MPCIPDYSELREMRAETQARVWGETLEKLIPSYVRFLPVFEALLAEHPDLAKQDEAQQCLAFMKQLAAYVPVQPSLDVDVLEAEGVRLRSLAESAESGLCQAGTLAWNATKGRSGRSAEVQSLLDWHQSHREEDRRARLEQLRKELRSIESRPDGDLSPDVKSTLVTRARSRIAELEALSVDAICSNRFVF